MNEEHNFSRSFLRLGCTRIRSTPSVGLLDSAKRPTGNCSILKNRLRLESFRSRTGISGQVHHVYQGRHGLLDGKHGDPIRPGIAGHDHCLAVPLPVHAREGDLHLAFLQRSPCSGIHDSDTNLSRPIRRYPRLLPEASRRNAAPQQQRDRVSQPHTR